MVKMSVKIIVSCSVLCLTLVEYVYSGTIDSTLPFSLCSTYFDTLERNEEKIYKLLREQQTLISADWIKSYVSDYEETELEISHRSNGRRQVSQSPQRIFRMVRRLVRILQPWLNNSRGEPNTTTLAELSHVQDQVQLPTVEDFHMVIEAILQIQFYYGLNLTEFVDGRIRGKDFGAKLNAEHCWDIAEYALSNKFYTLAQQWLEIINKSPSGEEEKVLEAKRLLAKDHNEHYSELLETQNQFIFVHPIEEDFPMSMRDYLLEKLLSTGRIRSPRHLFVRSIAVCNGHSLQEQEQKLNLNKCWLGSERAPYYFKIQPLRMELLSSDPFVAQVHDFIPEEWIELLKVKARPLLRKSPTTKQGKEYAYETAAYAWLRDESFIQEMSLIRRMEALTGLKIAGIQASLELQIASYVFGGTINEHIDNINIDTLEGMKDVKRRGEVITTLLLYLNDVEEGQGGLTSFPALGIAVRPTKGSVLWWYNSDPNGKVDYRLLHGGCPLIWGEKWIANKWTHINENMFKRPCTLTET